MQQNSTLYILEANFHVWEDEFSYLLGKRIRAQVYLPCYINWNRGQLVMDWGYKWDDPVSVPQHLIGQTFVIEHLASYSNLMDYPYSTRPMRAFYLPVEHQSGVNCVF